MERLKAELKETCPKETLFILVDLNSNVPSIDCSALFSVHLTYFDIFSFVSETSTSFSRRKEKGRTKTVEKNCHLSHFRWKITLLFFVISDFPDARRSCWGNSATRLLPEVCRARPPIPSHHPGTSLHTFSLIVTHSSFPFFRFHFYYSPMSLSPIIMDSTIGFLIQRSVVSWFFHLRFSFFSFLERFPFPFCFLIHMFSYSINDDSSS